MNDLADHDADRSEIYAMVSFGHKEKEGEKNANFFFFTYAGMVDAAKLIDPDIKIEWHGPNAWDPAPEITAIRALTARHVDGIIVTAADKTALDQAINDSIQAGIPVINFDADSPASDRLMFVGTDNYKAGYLAGKTMAEWLEGQGDVALSTIEHADHLNDRLRGFKDAMRQFAPQTNIYVAYGSGNIEVDESGRQDFTEYRESYIRMIEAHPTIRGLFATYASPGAGAVEAVDALNLQGKIQILAFDFDEVIIKLVESGKMRATVGQDSYMMGYVSMILTHAARHEARLPGKSDGAWCITVLTDFLKAYPHLHKDTATKLGKILSHVEESQCRIAIDTGAKILGSEELLDIIASDFENMRDSINEKIEALGREIEVRKRAEQNLRKLNAELEQRVKERTAEITRQKYILDSFLANVPDFIYFKDRDSRFIRSNQAHARLFGKQDPTELVGKSDFDFYPTEQVQPRYEQEQEIMRTGQPLLNFEESNAQGTWTLTTKMPLLDEYGEIIGTFGISRDITPLKQAQFEVAAAYEEIHILNQQLEEENLRMSAELDVSRRIQQMVLPSPEELQHIEGLEIVGFMKPATEVGGDYYDVLRENGVLHIGIGDVTGHGLESGILMLMTQTAIRTLIEHGETDPVVFLETLNRILYKNLQRMKVDKTLTLAFVNYQHGQVKLIGQHEELLVVRRSGQVERVDTINLGFPLGLEEHIATFVAERTISLQAGESVVLYTDGITEAENDTGELYGIERLCEVISQHWDQSAEAIKQAIVDDVTRYIGKQKVYDDLTLVVLKQK
jgi:PAS domain S-box-containing protein